MSTNKTRAQRSRDAARTLTKELRASDLNRPLCPRCGERGTHWIGEKQSLVDIMNKVPAVGRWKCKEKKA